MCGISLPLILIKRCIDLQDANIFGFVVFRLINLNEPKSDCGNHDLRINKLKLR